MAGPSKGLALRAPTERGQKHFLLKDFRPALEKAGRRPVHISFWEPPAQLVLAQEAEIA